MFFPGWLSPALRRLAGKPGKEPSLPPEPQAQLEGGALKMVGEALEPLPPNPTSLNSRGH